MYKSMHPNQAGATAWLVWDNFFVQDAVMYSSGYFDISLEGGVIPPAIPNNASTIVDQLAAEVALRAKAGYLVRGRADVDTVEARAGYAGRVQALYNSPATIIATGEERRKMNFKKYFYYYVVSPGKVSCDTLYIRPSTCISLI